MKAGLILLYILVGALAFWVLMEKQNIKKLEDAIAKLKNQSNAGSSTTIPSSSITQNISDKTSVTGSELWKQMQDKAKEITIDMKFE